MKPWHKWALLGVLVFILYKHPQMLAHVARNLGRFLNQL